MLKVPVYNLEGKESGNIDLNDKSFSVEFNPALVHQVAVALKNNLRIPAAHTKTKGEVRGGGKKPWKQKGTGRARAGSIRSPIWKGGGVTFGPRNNRNYHAKVNKRVGKLVFAMVVKAKAEDKELKVIDSLNISQPKTKELVKLLLSLDIRGQSVLLITAEKLLNLEKAGKNLLNLKIKSAKGVNTLDILNHQFVIIEKAAFELLIKRIS
ncbi:MAG: 50S ribosomal protein L4 [Candidatus Moraniibacteriota bacterium]